ncbi:MAG TPA: hypothetical protein PLL69_00725, partial [Gemmatimonadales bacterium]|nr:hypothetical protein [Gemmatimonadales bacterium]
FEPRWRQADLDTARERVRAWSEAWPRIAGEHPDHDGRPAQYTFFYPEEEYAPELLDPLADLARAGLADVEVHIHHDGEGEHWFMDHMGRYIENLHDRHGLLRRAGDSIAFGFIHGNWALDNSHPSGRWCGLNNELTLLRRLGCYADFTLPAAPDPCQTRRVNSIYWAIDDPDRPRSHQDGEPFSRHGTPPATGLLMVQGPLDLRLEGLRPKLEVGELAGHDPVVPGRIQSWLRAAPRIGSDVFLKLHAHGAPEKNSGPLLGTELGKAIGLLRQECDRRGWQLRHATAWQMVQAIQARDEGR